jgi:molecular chaperone DnaJ
MKDHYSTLGVDKTASQDDIKKAYRKLAFDYHPDRNQGNKEAEHKFKEVTEAYEVLGNEDKRKAYDAPQSSGFPFPFGNNMHVSPEDIFHSFFGFNGKVDAHRPRQAPKNRYVVDMGLSLQETLQGQERVVTVPTRINCSTCHRQGSQRRQCTSCNGSGKHPTDKDKTCGECVAGFTYPKCEACNGQGVTIEQKEVRVNIPRGVIFDTTLHTTIDENNEVLTRVHVQVPDNVQLGTDGRVIMETYVPYHIAVLGGAYSIPTVDGSTVSVNFPKLSNGQMLRVKGKGVYASVASKERGDMYVVPVVALPSEPISEEHKTIIEQLASLYNKENPNVNTTSTK